MLCTAVISHSSLCSILLGDFKQMSDFSLLVQPPWGCNVYVKLEIVRICRVEASVSVFQSLPPPTLQQRGWEDGLLMFGEEEVHFAQVESSGNQPQMVNGTESKGM